MLNLRFLGAAQSTTGSMHVAEYYGKTILLDCGLIQGKRKESFEQNRNLPIDVHKIDAIVLSHAHIDHSGRIPALIRQGYTGPIYSTSATKNLCEVMLRDSAFLQEKDVEFVNKRRAKQGKHLFELLYDQDNVDKTMRLFRTIEYGETCEIAPDLKLTFYDAGHILGSCTCTLDYLRGGKPRRLLFTGDLGQKNTPFLRDPAIVENVNVLITESTYGDRSHPVRENIAGRIKDYITQIIQKKSKLIIPAFSVGRTQQLLYIINELVEKKAIPVIPIYVDSPLSKKATEIHAAHTECFNDATLEIIAQGEDPFKFSGLKFISSVEESMALNDKPGPMVIISASGMCEGGRVLHHLRNNIADKNNIILITGFQAEDTLGRKIINTSMSANDKDKIVNIFGEECRLHATVFTINGLSGHADREGLVGFAQSLGSQLQHAFCIHGEIEYCKAHAENLRKLHIPKIDIPVYGQLFQNV